ncbi:unnamed protein product [Adineta steineri]|uniref:Uncharacterized protein n=1 Tax=Adineta steineri TaxID=433720 RepID=A0A814YKP0_9BILA|nr:unnamed protein product [Adineta steineri]
MLIEIDLNQAEFYFIANVCLYLDTARYATGIFAYQEKPPIYKVLSNSEIHDVPAGDHNLLDCLLLFVECVNSTRNGHLGSLNLGASGVDILWTIISPSSP